MEHLAIDLGARESQICIRDATGMILSEGRWPTAKLGKLLAERPKSRVILETCGEAFHVADQALAAGHEVRIVPGSLVRSLGVGARRMKNDRRDAQVLSETSCRIDLPSVHIPAALSRRRKSFCAMRESLVESRTMIANTVHGWGRGMAVGFGKGAVDTLPARVRKKISAEELPEFVERQLRVIEQLTKEIREADEQLARMAEKDDECRRLMTVPGVGPVTAIRFAAALDECGRFASAEKVASYLGLVPGEHTTGFKPKPLSITKAGPSALRRTLVQAAWASRRARGSHPMVAWSLEVEKRRGKRIAVVALARKIATILYAILRDGTAYDSSKGAISA